MVDAQGFLTPEIKPIEPAPEAEPQLESEVAPTPEVPVEAAPPVVEAPKVEVSEQPVRVPAPVQVAPVQKTELQTEIEDIMSKDLTDVFLALPDNKKEAFKVAGEEAASKIMILIQTGKVKVKKILDIIRDWLRVIPAVNKFFLEQEAKIKTDAIVRLVEEREKSGSI